MKKTEIKRINFAIDVPMKQTEEWINDGYFSNKTEAILYAKKKYGADNKGRINLITPL